MSAADYRGRSRLTLADHLNVDVVISQRRKKLPCDANTPFQPCADQAENGHPMHHIDEPVLLQFPHRFFQIFILDLILVLAATGGGDERRLGVHSKGDVTFVLLEEVHGERMLGKDDEDAGEEGRVADFAVRVHVNDRDVLLYRHRCGPFGPHGLVRIHSFGRVGLDDGAGKVRTQDVFDTDRDARNALLEREVMNHFAAVECQFPCFIRSEAGEKFGGWDLSWVGGTDAVDFLPHLKFTGREADSHKGGAKVGVAASEAVDEPARYAAEETGYNGDGVGVRGEKAAEGGREIAVEGLGQVIGNGKIDGIGEIDVSRRDAAV